MFKNQGYVYIDSAKGIPSIKSISGIYVICILDFYAKDINALFKTKLTTPLR